MARASSFALACAVSVGLQCTPAHAGALLPCFAATLSAHANILVVNDLTFEDQDETHGRKIKTSTYRVIRRYSDPNEGLRLDGPDTYWADPLWRVVFTNDGKSPFVACSYTLVTDDGEYLVLVNGQFGDDALTIYRRRDHPGQPFGGPGPDHGVLVRQVSWSELFPYERAPKLFVGGDPEWFAGGRFAFSSDNLSLIYKATSGKSVQILLFTGEVTR